TGRTPIEVNRTNMNVAQPKMKSFAKTAYSNVRRPFQGKSAVRTQFRVLRVSTVTKKIPTVDSKFFTADLGNKGKVVKASACWIWRPKQKLLKKGNSQNNIDDKGYWDSGCSQHMIGNISYLFEYEPYDGGYVSFGQGGGKITGKVYQMNVKSAFLYGTIDEEVYVMQPCGFQDPKFPDRVYKVEKAMYGLHQAPRAWYGTLSKYLLDNGFQRGTIDQTLFIRKQRGDFLLVQVYVDDIIFGSSNP
nr:putative ribonuclease H-like domain-containing protein [Tanacetum cinerariifolium]